jgi:hypothetical protein
MSFTKPKNYLAMVQPQTLCVALYNYCRLHGSHQNLLRIFLQRKRIKRFIGSWYIGNIIGMEFGLKREVRTLFSKIYAIWILSVIDLDGYIDSKQVDAKRASALVDEIREILKNDGSVQAETLPNRFEETIHLKLLFCELTKRISSFLQKYAASKNLFLQYAFQLLEGQEQSMRQRSYSEATDLNWYLNTVMPRKTYPFLLAPAALLANYNPELFSQLKIQLAELDEGCSFWQIQDDVADIETDLSSGILTAPLYYLIAQCKLAQQLSEGTIETKFQIMEEVEKNGMKVIGRIGNEEFSDLAEFTSCIFCNSTADKSLSYEQLLLKYTGLYRRINSQINHCSDLLPLIIESGVLNRLVGDINQFNSVASKITKHTALDFVGHLMRNALIRANNKYHETLCFIS